VKSNPPRYDKPKTHGRGMKYIIDGAPIPLARPRFGNGRTYDTQASQKNDCRANLVACRGRAEPLNGPIHMDVVFYMPIPKSLSSVKQKNLDQKPHHVKPDLSNLIKFIEDCANEICFGDDATISSITARKIYDDFPRTELTLTEIVL